MFDISLYSIEQDGREFCVKYHGNGCGRPAHVLARVDTPEAAAKILKALIDERL